MPVGDGDHRVEVGGLSGAGDRRLATVGARRVGGLDPGPVGMPAGTADRHCGAAAAPHLLRRRHARTTRDRGEVRTDPSGAARAGRRHPADVPHRVGTDASRGAIPMLPGAVRVGRGDPAAIRDGVHLRSCVRAARRHSADRGPGPPTAARRADPTAADRHRSRTRGRPRAGRHLAVRRSADRRLAVPHPAARRVGLRAVAARRPGIAAASGSRDRLQQAPALAVARVLDRDAEGRELVTQPVGTGPVTSGACRGPGFEQCRGAGG